MDDDETESLSTTTVSTQDKRELQPSVVEAVLSPSFTRKSQVSEAQQRCLDLQTQQHEAEMELLVIKKNNTIIEHKRKMEVPDAEFEYWETMKKSIKNTQEQQPRRNTLTSVIKIHSEYIIYCIYCVIKLNNYSYVVWNVALSALGEQHFPKSVHQHEYHSLPPRHPENVLVHPKGHFGFL